ncbi:MAG: noncanonical pyrimidine nucleotidase, YjjG family [Chitinophagia bacterium]|nr:noncanonical pyrimidine nucleotidase, YjjG family [Chitinophagia bacterium]
MSKQYSTIFFDLDHTLWDFDKNSEATLLRLYREYALNERGITDFNQMYAAYNTYNDMLWDKYRNGIIKRDELRWKRMHLMLLDYNIEDTSLAHEMGVAYLEILPTQTLLLPHTIEVLNYCKPKYQLHLLTNGFETTQRLKLYHSGIAKYFTRLVSSEKCNKMKPHKEIFDYALETCKVSSEEVVMIGDAIDIDIAGALNAGWDAIYFNPHKQLHDKKPTHEINSLLELTQIL